MIGVFMNTQHDTDTMSALFDKLAENPNNIVLVNPKRSELEEVLRSRPNETCVFLGHGSSNGLFRADDDVEYHQSQPADDWLMDDSTIDYETYYDTLYGDDMLSDTAIFGSCADYNGQLSFDFDDICPNKFSYYTPYIIDADNVDLLRDREIIGIWCYASDFATKYKLRGFFTYMFVSNPSEARFLSFGEHTTEEVDEQNIHFCNQINRFLNEGVEPQNFIENLEYDDSINFVHFNYSNMIYNYGY